MEKESYPVSAQKTLLKLYINFKSTFSAIKSIVEFKIAFEKYFI